MLTSSDEEEFYDAKEDSSPTINGSSVEKFFNGSSILAMVGLNFFSEIQQPFHKNVSEHNPVVESSSSSSSDPVSEQIIRRISQLKKPVSLSRASSYSDSNTTEFSKRPCEKTEEALPATANTLLKGKISDHRQTEKGKKSRDIISRIRIFQSRKPTKNDEMNGMECSCDSPSFYAVSENRYSIESTHSSIFSSFSSFHSTLPYDAPHVKTKSRLKSNKAFNYVTMAQNLTPEFEKSTRARSGNTVRAIWTMEFSKNGNYLAAAGQSCIIFVWEVLDGTNQTSDSIQVFRENPIRKYCGHLADILDLSWSKNNFLLSSSMDKTVRLWNVSREECLCVFKHKDIVTGVEFHPKDERYFLSGSMDCRVRLWNIHENKISYCNRVPDGQIITAISFSQDGKIICVGTYVGSIFFYDMQLRYNSQMTVKSKNTKKGKKITGIQTMFDSLTEENRLLVTSNDSHIYLINAKDKSIIHKYKGAANESMQIRASFCDDHQYIVCGSDNNSVYIWETEQMKPSDSYCLDKKLKQPSANLKRFGLQSTKEKTMNRSESQRSISSTLSYWQNNNYHFKNKHQYNSMHFKAHPSIVTSALFAPTNSRKLLANTGKDIIYNNTPVYVLINEEPATEESPDKSSTKDTQIMKPSNSFTTFSTKNAELKCQKGGLFINMFEDAGPEMRKTHDYSEGHIMISGDMNGCIKVWRVDSGTYIKSRPSSTNRFSIDSNTFANSSAMSSIKPSECNRDSSINTSFETRKASLHKVLNLNTTMAKTLRMFNVSTSTMTEPSDG
ncbi:WD40-repeat-containing domain protein [Spinellus fusiger]|nr:WD40-repeat-containing domain protein [Spinellus fusiger]